MKSVSSTILLLALISIPGLLSAQISGADLSEKLTVRIIPEFPKPNEPVTVRISSPSYNLDSSSIVWTANGEIVGQGTGVKEVTIQSQNIGVETLVTASITLASGAVFQKNININPAKIDFVWEAKTYTPPFYKGKALFSAESGLVVTVIPQIYGVNGAINPDDAIYKWTKNRQVLNNQSGYGKRSLHITGSFWGRDEEITVEVTSKDGSVRAKGSVVVSPKNPMVVIYEDSPLLGVLYNRAITSQFNLSQNKEVTFFSSPFYFSSVAISEENMLYEWSMNNEKIESASQGNSITFRAESELKGASLVGLSIKRTDAISQKSSSQFYINFE